MSALGFGVVLAIILVLSGRIIQPIVEVYEGQMERVFDRFYRTDSSRNSETGGHGIGLSVAKAIVTVHGGRISAVMEGEKPFVVSASF